jgi:hypothetical protein
MANDKYLSFTNTFKNDGEGINDYINSTCNGIGIFQNYNKLMYLMNCFMFDRQKIMFNILHRDQGNYGIITSHYPGLNNLWFMHFTMDIPIE